MAAWDWKVMVCDIEDSPLLLHVSQNERVRAVWSAIAMLGILGLGALLTPDSRGVGTHEQLGLPECMTMRIFGIPCPFCGMTTAFSHMAHGELGPALRTQPAGALAFLLAIGYLASSLFTAGTGKAPAAFRNKTLARRVWWTGVGIVAAAWIYKLTCHLLIR
ncbi:MAG: DUF2752 domain-containing protein [Candidatus Hydrogenedentes bacterium]|nr:DUF2752 domain-containing protein [Candidatus Hydrogenedentota bacterium]